MTNREKRIQLGRLEDELIVEGRLDDEGEQELTDMCNTLRAMPDDEPYHLRNVIARWKGEPLE